MPTKIEFGTGRLTDAQVIAEMSRRLVEIGLPWTWTPARVARHVSHPDSLVLVARAGPAVAGFAIMHFGDEVAHLNLLAVENSQQRQGLGRRLVEWLEKSATTAGTFVVCLEVRARNSIAQRFYRELGYEETGRLARYYSGREDAVRMTRDLRHPLARPDAEPPKPSVQVPGSNPDAPDWFIAQFRR